MPSAKIRELFVLVILLAALRAATGTQELSSQHSAETPINDQGRPHLSLQVGHTGAVKVVTISPDGKMLASGGLGNVVKLWDLRTSLIVRTFATQGTMGVATIVFSPDGKTLVTGGPGQDVELWNLETGELRRTLPVDKHDVWSVAFSPDGTTLASAGGLLWGEIRLWDVVSGKAKLDLVSPEKSSTLRSGYAMVYSIAFSPDGKILAGGGSDGTVRLWEVNTGNLKQKLPPQGGTVSSVAFCPTGTLLASASEDKTVDIWYTSTGELKRKAVSQSGFSSLSFSPDCKLLAAGTTDGSIHLWDMEATELSFVWTAHRSYVWSIVFSPDGRTIATGSGDGTIRLWDTQSQRLQRTLQSRSGAIAPPMAYAPDGHTLAIGGDEGWVRFWDIETGHLRRLRCGDVGEVSSVDFSFDRKIIAVGGERGVAIVDLRSENSKTLRGYSGSVNAVVLAPDGKTLVSASDDQNVRVWDVQTGELKRTLAGHKGKVYSVAFSRDGKMMASAGEGTEIIVWDAEKGMLPQPLPDHSGRVESVAFSPDGKTLASGDVVSLVKLWDWKAGAAIRTLAAPPYVVSHQAEVEAVAFSPDGHTLVSASADKTARLWDTRSGQLKETLLGHTDGVHVALFSPTQPLLVTAGYDTTLRLWNLTSGKELATFIPFGEQEWVAIARDGRFDASELDQIGAFAWVFPDDPFRPLAPEIFMRDYYEPHLLPRLVSGEELPKVRPLASLNRVQPFVNVEQTEWQDAAGGIARVTVKVSGNREEFPHDGKMVEVSTGVYDLRVFRDGQLVGWAPKSSLEWQLGQPPTGARADELDLQRWREKTRIDLDADGTKHLTFVVQVPRRPDLKQVTFTAYAFNEDRVKSSTASGTLVVSSGLKARLGKAYIVCVGVNRTESSPSWDLQYAANDARKLSEVVSQKLGATNQFNQVVPVVLVSGQLGQGKAGEAEATKANLQSVLDVLAGRRKVDEQLKKEIPGAGGLEKAQPEDLVLLAFSSHGYTDARGVFHIVLADIGKNQPQDRITEELQKRTLSSDELSSWLREVDVGELVMIVDTCHSEATVAYDGFKPGPMGSRGLGQLAYDKGMRILAASKSGQSAIELGGDIKEGLLSYALVHEGLEEGKADFQPKDGKILMSEWLAYGAKEVPNLYTSGRAKGPDGERPTVQNTKDIIYLGRDPAPPSYQQPVLFDFGKSKRDVVLSQ